MTKYPQILLPKKLVEVLSTKEYTKPSKPIEPSLPEKEPNQVLTKLFFLIIGIGTFFLYPIVGTFLAAFSLYLLFSNYERKEFDKKMQIYTYNKKQYNLELENYTSSVKMSSEEFSFIQRKKAVENNLATTEMPTTEIDYKKGASHDYFKDYLKIHFGDLIVENATIKSKTRNYNEDYEEIDFDERRSYITDFAYVNFEKRFCLAIEIDEPYTLIDKKPIHINDSNRNRFFIKKNWAIIRFAEEQIVLYPSNCCYIISSLIKSVIEDNDIKNITSLTSKIENVPKWTAITVTDLIKNNHRKKILEIMAQNEQNKTKRLEGEELLKKFSESKIQDFEV